jgi:hypothetical protein
MKWTVEYNPRLNTYRERIEVSIYRRIIAGIVDKLLESMSKETVVAYFALFSTNITKYSGEEWDARYMYHVWEGEE